MKNGLFGFVVIVLSLIPVMIFVAGMAAIFGEGAFTAYVSYPLGLLVWFYTIKELDKLLKNKSGDDSSEN